MNDTTNTIPRILVINPGSTTTKIAVYDGPQEVVSLSLRHDPQVLCTFGRIADQHGYRKKLILDALREHGIELDSLSMVIGRGGLVKPIHSGVYEVNEALKRDLTYPPQGEHASNLGGMIAAEIAASLPGVRAYIADPVVVDELEPVARISGHPLFRRVSIFHALNQKAKARAYAAQTGRKYEELNLIVAHLGGGISIGAHRRGTVIDVNNALDGEGPFSPERAGTLPAGSLVDLCFSGTYTHDQMRKMIAGEGGLVAYTGSNNLVEIIERAKAGEKIELQNPFCCKTPKSARTDSPEREVSKIPVSDIVRAMAYQVGKSIGGAAAVLHGAVDAIILTGGMAHSRTVCREIEEMVSSLAPVIVMPGEDEMRALAENALRVWNDEQQPREYF